MIQSLKDWLMGLIAASVLCAAAESLMPQGSVRRVGQLVCGLVLLLLLLKPLSALTGVDAAGYLAGYAEKLRQEESLLQEQVEQGQKAVIEEHCAAYISDKAADLGVTCRAEVVCAYDADGLCLPVEVSLWGAFSDVQQSRLTELLEQELGIAPDRQHYYLAKEEGP